MTAIIPLLLILLSPPSWAQDSIEAPRVSTAIRTNNRAAKDYAIIIGNESYRSVAHAPYAHADATSFREFFRRTRGMSRYRSRVVANRTARQMRAELRRALYRVGRGGTIWVVFAGHGASTPGGLDHALLGVDATIDDVLEGAVSGGVPITEIADVLSNSTKADRIILIADASFGGPSRDGRSLAEGETLPTPTLNTLEDTRFTTWIAATGLAKAGIYKPASQGLFTYLVLGALRGWADGEIDGQKDGKVSLAEAQLYTAWTARKLGRATHPSMDSRSHHREWIMAQGEHLETGPRDDVLAQLQNQDLDARHQDAAQRIRAEAAAFWPDALEDSEAGGEEGRAALQSFISAYASASIQVEVAIAIPEVAAARKRLAQWGREIPSETVPVEQPQAIATISRCDDIVALENKSMLGQLGDDLITCLENRLITERLQTTKDKVSRVLIEDARSRKDPLEWERLVRRHLEQYSRADPEMCMAYAVHLFGVDKANESIIRWAEVALENKHVWSGKVHVQRVAQLLRLRAIAAYQIWVGAQADIEKERTRENEGANREYRGWAMDFAREWLEYVLASGLPSKSAYETCLSAAGTARFCASG
jgi:hypothetical protein